MPAVGGQERGLVHAELADPADPIGVADQRGGGAVLADRVHDRPPAHSELVEKGRASSPGCRHARARRVSTTSE